MIVVKIELHSAITGQIEEIGRMYIANDGTGGMAARGNYDVRVMRQGATEEYESWASVTERAQRRARVENYPRLSLSVWELVRRALDAAFGGRAKRG